MLFSIVFYTFGFVFCAPVVSGQQSDYTTQNPGINIYLWNAGFQHMNGKLGNWINEQVSKANYGSDITVHYIKITDVQLIPKAENGLDVRFKFDIFIEKHFSAIWWPDVKAWGTSTVSSIVNIDPNNGRSMNVQSSCTNNDMSVGVAPTITWFYGESKIKEEVNGMLCSKASDYVKNQLIKIIDFWPKTIQLPVVDNKRYQIESKLIRLSAFSTEKIPPFNWHFAYDVKVIGPDNHQISPTDKQVITSHVSRPRNMLSICLPAQLLNNIVNGLSTEKKLSFEQSGATVQITLLKKSPNSQKPFIIMKSSGSSSMTLSMDVSINVEFLSLPILDKPALIEILADMMPVVEGNENVMFKVGNISFEASNPNEKIPDLLAPHLEKEENKERMIQEINKFLAQSFKIPKPSFSNLKLLNMNVEQVSSDSMCMNADMEMVIN